MENKQTAIDYLEKNVFYPIKWDELLKVLNEAKAIEKQQIIDAYEYGNTDRDYGIYLEAEDYYNKTYGTPQ